MNSKVKETLKDGAVGAGIGCAVIVPGISGGTIALVTGAFKKIVTAVDKLFSKLFWKNLAILIPFGIGAVLAIAALYFPITLAFEHCMLAIVCLFAGFMVGSVPSVTDKIKDKKPNSIEILFCVAGFILVVLFGVLSLLFNLNSAVLETFNSNPWYLYPILLFVGIISSTGLIVPGFSGSMLLMVIGFYDKILNLVKQIPSQPGWSILRLFTFAVGVLLGFVLFSKLMKKLFEKHPRIANFVVLGFLVGSIIAIYVNDQMFDYLKSSLGTLDYVLSPVFLIVGFVISYLIVRYERKQQEGELPNA
ncbi:MAG: DUF368 domain-containing protein [Bacilli bacterium]|nr:DUF368 domain-containing protein [Bacilli bacterium]MDY6363079.1 DUF368 domain-containing protein [Bacilli bacterium]